MQFSSRRRKIFTNPQTELYGHCLQFYGQPPLENISLTEFETFAVERLKLLKTVENLGVSYVKTSEQYSKKLDNEFSNLNFPYRTEADDKKTQSGPSEYEKRRKDHISHFILRLAYCQTEDLRRWFIQQEVDLFRYRFNDLPPKYKLEFLHRNNLEYNTISLEEKKALSDKLVNSSYAVSGITVEDQDFYKVPFQDALDLVRTRKVYLKAGYVYIPHQDIVTIVLNDFRTRLSKALA
ncbi:DNA primase large subunit-like, partial [Centroberyx affinis]|uniref:DNA primase large subunit-like n=1 Tax=Centroberyx affinis TaxID=166261 RepID=UPI003A5C03EC